MKQILKSFFNNSRVVGCLFLLLSGSYLWSSQLIPLDFWSETEPFNARTMPYLFGYSGVVIASLMIILPSPKFDWHEFASLRYLPALSMLVLLSAYGYSIEYLGFLPATILLLASGFWILGERNALRISLVALALSVGFYFCMSLLDIYLSPGELWMQHD